MVSVVNYNVSLLNLDACPVKKSPMETIAVLKAWRKGHGFVNECSECNRPLSKDETFVSCCNKFFHNAGTVDYPVRSIAVPTPGFQFVLTQMKKRMERAGIESDQDFLIIPDPIYWQMSSTLVYEKVMKFVMRLPVTSRTKNVLPVSKTDLFYNQIIETPLNYGSLKRRSCGKTTLIRQVAFGKRCVLSMRGMIVPDASLRPNEIRLPQKIIERFGLADRWIILNRMPSLQPGNFVALFVNREGWPYDVFGIPLEIVQAINGDFDGDECNVYLVPSVQSQAECATLLNPRVEMGCFVMGIKLAPSQDMLTAYYLHYDEIDFLPYKCKNLKTTLLVIYEYYGSETTFHCFDRLREFYLRVLQDETCFALTLREMIHLSESKATSVEEFMRENTKNPGCLVTQVLAGAKGSDVHLYQLFRKIGRQQDGKEIESSFWNGLNVSEFVLHCEISNQALKSTTNIWRPGYGFNKIAFTMQGVRIDQMGRMVDGENRIIEKDVLNALHYTNLLSNETFKHLFRSVMK